jgi:Spy/CpxP family protein refolding chaperone
MKSFRVATALLFVLSLAGWAQDRAAARTPQTRERLRENINNLRLLRMTQVLDLDEEQTARVFPVYTRIEKEKSEYQRSLTARLRELRQALRQTPYDDARILETTKAIRGLQDEIRAKDLEFEAFLGGVLTPVQQGKYLLFMVEFYRGLGDNLERLREAAPKIKRGP